MTWREGLLFLIEVMGVVAVTLLLTLSPRFRHPPLVFRYPRREGGIASALFGLTLAGTFLYLRTGGMAVSPLSAAQVNIMGMTLLLYLGALVARGQPLRSAGWGRATLLPALQLGLGLIFITLFLRGQFMHLLKGISHEQGQALIMSLILAVGEESIFRGYLLPRWSAWLGSRTGLVVNGLAFALWRLPWVLTAPIATMITTLGIAFAQGLLLGWIMQKSHHVLAGALYRGFSDWLRAL
ncbi:CPBP family glutamic-type intramembrane protease [Thermanaerothrix sp. 4228-RoL]|jgi:membrane protease YdiL (CAAX protease family)|uniref:CPBP family glutamic-type intramembrane protease n=1 Tax=Thermanaerothrix solaris TaxID=3058434 RepID=A0ABU3NRD6_9CHLR|nr:CPBP family glutamic-type intramembrane protease [Thermanaerothrix sp. 4228-RoL]MDT8898930.1 CPBP family glutamic-type intramembrane protease [Thermanaerothrix sp. 4228-RoL]